MASWPNLDDNDNLTKHSFLIHSTRQSPKERTKNRHYQWTNFQFFVCCVHFHNLLIITIVRCLHLSITGNGPSGITLSYMLSGHWPYWLPDRVSQHPDELLRARLNFAETNKSLVEQDLVMLADGLEGRSTNPVSLLVCNIICSSSSSSISFICVCFHSSLCISHIKTSTHIDFC